MYASGRRITEECSRRLVVVGTASVDSAHALASVHYLALLSKLSEASTDARGTPVSVALSCGSVRAASSYDRNDMWSALTHRLALLCTDNRQKREFSFGYFLK